MRMFIFAFLLSLVPLLSATQEKQSKQETQELTKAQQLWGRKFQASLGYTYFAGSNHHGLDIGYGVWDHNKLGILANIFFPLAYAQGSKIYLVSFYGVWDYNPISWLNIMPKVGYGPKFYQIKGGGGYLSWEPTAGVDITFNINSFVRIYTSYTWSMFENERHKLEQLHGLSAGIRIAY